MTTIKVTSHNYPALVELRSRIPNPTGAPANVSIKTEVITPEDGEKTYHCTTTLEVRVVDLEYDDHLVLAHKASAVGT